MKEVLPYGIAFILAVTCISQCADSKHDNLTIEALEAQKDSLSKVIKTNKAKIDTLLMIANSKDTIIIERNKRAIKTGREDHEKINNVDNIADDSIYKLLTDRYFKLHSKRVRKNKPDSGLSAQPDSL